MPSQIRPEDLDLVEPSDGDVSFAAPPRQRRGRTTKPSKYLAVVARASKGAEDGTRPEQLEDVEVQVGPWAHHPADHKPVVGYEARKLLLNAFGPGTDYHAENGFYFEVLLSETVRVPSKSTGDSSRAKGVLWVRKVITELKAG